MYWDWDGDWQPNRNMGSSPVLASSWWGEPIGPPPTVLLNPNVTGPNPKGWQHSNGGQKNLNHHNNGQYSIKAWGLPHSKTSPLFRDNHQALLSPSTQNLWGRDKMRFHKKTPQTLNTIKHALITWICNLKYDLKQSTWIALFWGQCLRILHEKWIKPPYDYAGISSNLTFSVN